MEPDKNPLLATDGTEAAHPRPPEPRAGVRDTDLADPAAQLDEPVQTVGISFGQYAFLVAVGAFATTFAQQRVIGNYPTLFLLKSGLHLKREDVAVFFFWASFAWNLKPLAGILTDAFPIFGTRRRSYMLLGAAASGVLWMLLALFPHDYQKLLIVSVLMNVATVFASTVMGGLMVEAGQRFSASGRMSSLRQIVQSIAGIAAPALGGYLAGKAFGWSATSIIGGVTMFLLAAVTFFFFREKPAPHAARPGELLVRPPVRIPVGVIIALGLIGALGSYLFTQATTRNIGISLFALLGMFFLIFLLMLAPSGNPVVIRAQHQLADLMQSRTLWMAVVMLFLVYTVPGLGTALTYRQEDVLKFPRWLIGMLGSLEGVTGLVAATAYALGCRVFKLRTLLTGAIAVNAAATLLYLIYNQGTAPYIHGLGGFLGVLSELALMDLAVRSTPVGCEALGFSLMMSVRNFGIALSDVLGTKLMDDFHVSFVSLVWVNAGTTLLILLFIPFLPAAIMRRREGEPETSKGAEAAAPA